MNSAENLSENSLLDECVISVNNVGKTYKLYPSHQDRLKEALHPFRKRYHNEFSSLTNVSFEIKKGESVGVLGRNGAGKSTLLQLIAGVLSPTHGSIKVAGKVAALLELGAGFNPDLTGRENVVLASTIDGVSKGELTRRVAEVESFADIGMFFDQPVKVYSSGMFARVAFANAINVNPDILIIDEILGVGDAKFQEKCYHKINSLKESGVCILFVSHSTEVIQRNCERALLLDGGRLVMYGQADAAVAAYQDLLYGAKKVVEQRNIEKIDRSEREGTEKIPAADSELESFLRDEIGQRYKSKPNYNSNERRMGNGKAEIMDYLVLANGKEQFEALQGNELLNIYIKVKYHGNIKTPQIGWGLATIEGIHISGSNTVMQHANLPSASKGDVVIYNQELQLSLSGGQFFLNIGIGESDNGEWIFLDNRRSFIHFAVKHTGLSDGFFLLQSNCKVTSGV